MLPHAHDLPTLGLLGLGLFLEVVANNAVTALSATSIVCGILFGAFNAYIAWRNSEARLATYRTRLFREWEAAKDKAV